MRKLVLFLACSLVCTQLFAQVVPRKNRVWSMRIELKPCGLKFNDVRIAAVDMDGELGQWRRVNPDLFILQWSHDIPDTFEKQKTYTIYDLLQDYAQTIYIVRVIGESFEGAPFVKMFWISPAGMSAEPIPRAAVREDKSVAWTKEDNVVFNLWYRGYHQWTVPHFFYELRGLVKKPDKRVELPVFLKTATSKCVEGD